MKKLTLLCSILTGCVLMTNIAYAEQCTRLMVNHTHRVLYDLKTGAANSPGNNLAVSMNCRQLANNYDFGTHRYWNRQYQFIATTTRDVSNPNYVKIVISDR